MNDECIICGSALEYLPRAETMRCALCRRSFSSFTRCSKGHYICDECHRGGLDGVMALCLAETSPSPGEILEKLMALPEVHMHGPEHHILVVCALAAAYKNAGGSIDLPAALGEIRSRGQKVPGGICGNWGSCGAAVSAGIFMSVLTGSTPLAGEAFGLCNTMTSRALALIGELGGPRCCKRNSMLAVSAAIELVSERLGVEMERRSFSCGYTEKNNQCIGGRCPFHSGKR